MPAQAQPQIPVSRIADSLLSDAASIETAAEELRANGADGTPGDPLPDPLPPGHVFPMDYRALRNLAEWASGMRNRQLRFDYRATPDGTGELVTVDLTHEGAPGTVVVPAFTTGKEPPVRYVELMAEGAANSVNAVERLADAVFWSESAVEKFLVPYYASCAGAEAVKFLEKLLGAFNTPWTNVKVFALLHRGARPTGEPLSLATAVEVVYLDVSGAAPTVGVLGLDAFLAYARPGDPLSSPPPASVPYSVGSISATEPRYPAYLQLREMAEWTSSIRGTTLYFRHNVVTGALNGPTTTLPPVLENEVVIPVSTPEVLRGRLAPSAVWMQPDTLGGPFDLAHWADSLFLSTGAIEQFLFPYYASTQGAEAMRELARLYDAWMFNQPKPEVVWFTGAAAGSDGPVPGEAEATLAADGETEEAVVYGLVHLPKSDWVTVTGGGEESSALSSLGVVHTVARTGETRLLSARDFLARHARGR